MSGKDADPFNPRMDVMFKRALPGISVALASIAIGCAPAKAPPTSAVVSARASVAARPANNSAAEHPSTDSVTLDNIGNPAPAPGSADFVAQRARAYAERMDQLAARRAAAEQASSLTPGNSPAAPSAVRFLDPHDRPKIPGEEAIAANLAMTPARAADPRTNGSANAQIASQPPAVSPAPAPTITQTPVRPEIAFNKDTPALNTPLIVAQPRPLLATDDLAQRFAQQARDYPQDVAAHFDWQLLQYLQGQSVPQLQSLSTLAAEDRELLCAVLDGLTNFRSAIRADSNMLLSKKIHPIIEMADRLKAQAELTLPTVALCTDVKGFGVYDPIEPPRFEAGVEHRVIVYCEVENFSSVLDEQKRWETKLSQEVVLYTEQGGEEIWRDRVAAHPIVDYSRNRRHDFFIVKMIRLPANLSLGRYLLKVSVIDNQMNRVAENTTPIQIIAQ